ncbi:hypothetical protein FHX16_005307 [Rhizobium sp. BK661]|nr:hypothetical protein [Rhizobium sp. BK661]
MTRVTLHPSIEAAPEAARPRLEAIKKQMGGVPNVFRMMSNSPAVLEPMRGSTARSARASWTRRSAREPRLLSPRRTGAAIASPLTPTPEPT